MPIDCREGIFGAMKFGYEHKKDGLYGSTFYLKYLPVEKMVSRYLAALVNSKKYIPYIFISTVVKDSFWSWKQRHLMVLDCDSAGDMAAACHWLKTEEPQIEYEIIESTPGRFWVVTNHLGTWKQVWNVFNHIPGVCNAFRNDYAKKYERICIRAFPKLVRGKPHTPVFPEEIKFPPMSAARTWMLGAQLYFESRHFQKISKALMLVDKLDKKMMEQLAADPTFQV
jgi:hypothetical protein